MFAECGPRQSRVMENENEKYDIIGDLHGEAEALRDLLARLGYRERDGAYRHSGRRALFLGDYIDRGPAIRETLGIVRAMVERGTALALCGNHELDALMYDTPDGCGGWLRPHNACCASMHARTHAEFAARPDEWLEWRRWFQSLPLYLDLPGFRAVHACWNETQIAVLGERRLDDDLLRAAADLRTPESVAVRRLLKGPEVRLPAGTIVGGLEGKLVPEMRLRWWYDGRGDTYREACIHRHGPGPATVIPAEFDALFTPPCDGDRPVFIGHYWMPPQTPAPLTPLVACCDYSVAGGGPLVAYRWEGEQRLSAEKFIYDPARLPLEAAAA